MFLKYINKMRYWNPYFKGTTFFLVPRCVVKRKPCSVMKRNWEPVIMLPLLGSSLGVTKGW